MKKITHLVAAVVCAFAFTSFGAHAVPKAAETADGTVVDGQASAPKARAAAAKAEKKKPATKPSGKTK